MPGIQVAPRKRTRLAGTARSAQNWAGGSTRRRTRRPGTATVLLLSTVAFMVALVAGFVAGVDRHVREGLRAHQNEAAARSDWVEIGTLPTHVPMAFASVADPASDLVRQLYRLRATPVGRARQLVTTELVEWRFSREEILELYLNRIYLGQEGDWPVYGVYHAARQYLSKDATDLTLSEAATLAGLLLAPQLTAPVERPGAAGARRNEVLRSLSTEAGISARLLRGAAAEPLAFQPGLRYRSMAGPAAIDGEPAVIRIPRPPPDPPEE